MQTININERLFSHLKNSYRDAKKDEKYHTQFLIGFDYLESLVKLFGSVMISVVKEKNPNLYDKLIKNDFQLHPALGNYINLVNNPLSGKNSKLLIGDPLYDFLYTLLATEKKEGVFGDIIYVLKGEKSVKTHNIVTTKNLLGKCVGIFRNKTKGHGGAFSEDDVPLRKNLLAIMDTIISTLEKDYDKLVEKVKFEIDDNRNSTEYPLFVRFKNKKYPIIPVLAYIGCEHSICSGRQKLFFYNGGKETKPEYLNHSYSHSSFVSPSSNFHPSISKFQLEINKSKKIELLKDFVGREKEIEESLKHIQNNDSSLMKLHGKPGIGKSAFLTQLEERLQEQNSDRVKIYTHIFYAVKGKMDVEEDKSLFSSIHAKFNTLSIQVKYEENESTKSKLEKLFNAYEESEETLPLVLMVDGLDEFESPSKIIDIIPLNFSSKIHLILSFRNIEKIMQRIDEGAISISREAILTQELGKLEIKEVEVLLSQVLPREIDVESNEYKDIVKTIALQSEGLPLYIHFITQKLKDIKNSINITKEILKWAKNLPPKLDEFYQEVFKSIEPLSREILYVAYMAKTGVELDIVYDILAEENSEIDEVLFKEKFFNEIEIFLKYDANGDFVFYHLSVKEAILEYQKNQNSILTYNLEKLDSILLPSQIEHYAYKINSIEYIKSKSTIYKTLQKSINYLENNRDRNFANKNLIHLFNTLVWTHIYHNQISYDDMKSEKYSSLQSAVVSDNNKKEINKLLGFMEQKETQRHRYEIRYAYELAFLVENYDKVLAYKDMYELHIQDMFLEIALNIDKQEYIEKFIEYKDDWLGSVNEAIQDIFINIISNNNTLDNSFYNILTFLTDQQKLKLITTISVEKSLEIARGISYSSEKSRALIKIVTQTDDKELLEKALEIANEISSDKDKLEALIEIATRIDDKAILERVFEIIDGSSNDYIKSEALEVITLRIDNKEPLTIAIEKANEIFNDRAKSKALVTIAFKTDDKELLEKSLGIVHEISDDRDKSKALVAIVSKIEDKKLLKRALTIANKISWDRYKLETLIAIVSKVEDNEIFDKALEIANEISDDIWKYKLLILIASKIENIEEALSIANKISNNRDKAEALVAIALKTGNKKLLGKALEISNKISYSWHKSYILREIVSQTKSIEKALEIANEIIYDKHKLEVLATIVSKTDDKKLLKEVLEIAKTISDDKHKADILILTASKIDDRELLIKILEMVKEISDDKAKSEILVLIVSQIDNREVVEKSLEIANEISNESEKSKALAAMVPKIENLEIALEIANKISDDRYKVEALVSIMSKTDEKKILEESLEIVHSIPENWRKTEALIAIVSKMENIEKALDMASEISDNCIKSKILSLIVTQIDNKKLLKKALEIMHGITEDRCKLEALVSIVSITDDRELLNEAIMMVNEISFDGYKPEFMMVIASKLNDNKLSEQSLEIASEIPHDWRKTKALVSILSKTDDIEVALKIVNNITDSSDKSKSLVSIVSKMDNKELLKKSLKIARSISDNSDKLEVLVAIISKAKDKAVLENALEVANELSCDWHKSEALVSIVSKTDDKELFEKALDIASKISNNTDKLRLLKYRMEVFYCLLFKQLFNTETKVLETMEIVRELSSDSILKYYGINFQETDMQNILKELRVLKLQRDKAEEDEEEVLYDSITEKADTLKKDIYNSKKLLEEFLDMYDISKMKFKKQDILGLME